MATLEVVNDPDLKKDEDKMLCSNLMGTTEKFITLLKNDSLEFSTFNKAVASTKKLCYQLHSEHQNKKRMLAATEARYDLSLCFLYMFNYLIFLIPLPELQYYNYIKHQSISEIVTSQSKLL